MSEPIWNLYALIDGESVLDLILPDEATLTLPPAPTADGWFAVRWPVNPHFTGRSGIRIMLEAALPTRKPIPA